MMVTTGPVAEIDTTVSSDTENSKLSVWPSGSVKWADTSTVADSPAGSSCEAIAPTANGARLGTSTRNCWSALSPVASVAVTVTTAAPGATPATVIRLLERLTVTMPGSEVIAP